MHLPEPPPWMVDLPRLHHPAKAFQRLPSHAASRWESGHPIFTIDPRRSRILAVRGYCWQCGHPVNGAGYLVITEDAEKHYGDLLMAGIVGPLHRSCALYASAGACPFLRYPDSRRRSLRSRRRGTASVRGFEHYGTFWLQLSLGGALPFFGHWSPTADSIALTSHAHIAELYEQAVTTDAAANFTATPRLFWTDSPDDLQRLNTDWADAKKAILDAKNSTVTIDGRTYCGRQLDQPRAGI